MLIAALMVGLLSQGEVMTVGSMRETMREGKIEARTALAGLNAKPHMYALGPVEGLRGEITVVDGVIHVGTVSSGKPVANVQKDAKAVFLAYSYVGSWREFSQPAGADLAGIAAAIEKAGPGLDRTPFVVSGTVEAAGFHIMDYIPDGEAWSMEKHDVAKAKFGLASASVTLVGFFTTREEDAGVFVHHSDRLHVHLVSDGRTGHLDSVSLRPGWTLKLPAR
jgi:acetolactate decarboxylase